MSRARVANHVSRQADFMVCAPLQKVLPLFGPAREADWADGWKPSFVTDGWQPGEPPQEGLVFTVGSESEEQIWTLLRFDRLKERSAAEEPLRVEYLRIQPGSHVAWIRIASAAAAPDRTKVEVSYELTALSGAGMDYLSALDPASFRSWIATWPVALEHYLETGEALPGGH